MLAFYVPVTAFFTYDAALSHCEMIAELGKAIAAPHKAVSDAGKATVASLTAMTEAEKADAPIRTVAKASPDVTLL